MLVRLFVQFYIKSPRVLGVVSTNLTYRLFDLWRPSRIPPGRILTCRATSKHWRNIVNRKQPFISMCCASPANTGDYKILKGLNGSTVAETLIEPIMESSLKQAQVTNHGHFNTDVLADTVKHPSKFKPTLDNCTIFTAVSSSLIYDQPSLSWTIKIYVERKNIIRMFVRAVILFGNKIRPDRWPDACNNENIRGHQRVVIRLPYFGITSLNETGFVGSYTHMVEHIVMQWPQPY